MNHAYNDLCAKEQKFQKKVDELKDSDDQFDQALCRSYLIYLHSVQREKATQAAKIGVDTSRTY